MLYTLKLSCILSTLVVTLLAGSYPFWQKLKNKIERDFEAGESLACGIFLGAGILHMLPDAAKGFAALNYVYPMPFLLAGCMFLLLLLLEHIGREVYQHDGKRSLGFVILSVLMLSIHSFIAGVSLGVSDSTTVVVMIFIAILAHKWAESFALAIQISNSRLKLKYGISLFIVFALMLPSGFILGVSIMESMKDRINIEPFLNALAAGTFLYLGTLHGLKQAVLVDKCCDLKRFTYVNIGFFIMALVAIWV